MTPDQARKLADEALAALRRKDPASAVAPLEALTGTGRASFEIWLLLARAHNMLGNDAAEEQALDRTLKLAPRDVRALLMKGDCRARAGDSRAALSFRSRGVAEAQAAAAPLPPDLAAAVAQAQAAIEQTKEEWAAAVEASIAREVGSVTAPGPRFAEALELLKGKKQVYFQKPSVFFYPRLPHIQFFEREDFPWAAKLEASAPAILDELRNVIAGDAGFRPYVQPEPNRPAASHVLMEDPRWSAFDLIRNGERVEGNTVRCPETMAALEQVPLCTSRGRSPSVLFSVLKPGTRIPPHHGLLNTRLICHLPLIVPDGCGIRVGNETREWRFGELIVFDDSIEHEAWNDSGETRVVLIFEIWRPELSEIERRALRALFEAMQDQEEEDEGSSEPAAVALRR